MGGIDRMRAREHEVLSKRIIGCAMQVHSALGLI